VNVLRHESDRLAFLLDPAPVVAALVVFARGEGRPIWAVAHPSVALTETVGHVTEITAAPHLASAKPSSTEGFVQVGPPLASDGFTLSRLRIGETPQGMVVAVPWRQDVAAPGSELTLVVMGSKTGFINFTV
jgi:hypothetical protein